MSGSRRIPYRQARIAEDTPEFTGERFIPGIGGQIEVEHVHRYLFARQFAGNRDVLDIACGEGYGSALMSSVARSVVGVDIDEPTIERARKVHQGETLRFETGSCLAIPIDDDAVDVVVCYETIEHIAEHGTFVGEIRRVLRPGGLLLMSTPDPDNYLTDTPEDNPFHVKELRRAEFIDLLGKTFDHARFGAQQCFAGSALLPLDDGDGMSPPELFRLNAAGMEIEDVGRFGDVSLYLIGLASDASLPDIDWSLLDDPDYAIENVMRLRHDTSLVVQSVAELKKMNEAVRAEYEAALATANKELNAVRRSMVVRVASRLGLVRPRSGDGS